MDAESSNRRGVQHKSSTSPTQVQHKSSRSEVAPNRTHHEVTFVYSLLKAHAYAWAQAVNTLSRQQQALVLANIAVGPDSVNGRWELRAEVEELMMQPGWQSPDWMANDGASGGFHICPGFPTIALAASQSDTMAEADRLTVPIGWHIATERTSTHICLDLLAPHRL